MYMETGLDIETGLLGVHRLVLRNRRQYFVMNSANASPPCKKLQGVNRGIVVPRELNRHLHDVDLLVIQS